MTFVWAVVTYKKLDFFLLLAVNAFCDSAGGLLERDEANGTDGTTGKQKKTIGLRNGSVWQAVGEGFDDDEGCDDDGHCDFVSSRQ